MLGSKELMVSTPGMIGECPVTEAYEASDGRRFYGCCPHCDGFFAFEPEGFVPGGETFGHHFVCPGCHALVEDTDRPTWRQRGVWIAGFRAADDEANPQPPAFIEAADIDHWRARATEGREPGYYIWQAMCGLISFDKIATTIAEAKTPSDKIALEQQTFGRAYDPSIDALAWEDLHRLREDYDREIVPAGAGVLTGFADVQGGYLEWGVIGWGPGAEWWVVDRGVIDGDTAGDDVWRALDEVTRRHYPHADGGALPIEAFGLDTGFRTQRCYSFTRGRPNCYAMDGRPGWKIPILGKPKMVKVVQSGRLSGRVKLWPSGTWETKSLLAWSLKTSIEAGYAVRLQGRGHWSRAEDENWCQQITAEHLIEERNAKTGQTDRRWAVMSGRRNEWVDIWVGARALAWSLGVGAPPRKGGPGEGIDWATRANREGAPAPTLFDKPAPVPEPAGRKPLFS